MAKKTWKTWKTNIQLKDIGPKDSAALRSEAKRVFTNRMNADSFFEKKAPDDEAEAWASSLDRSHPCLAHGTARQIRPPDNSKSQSPTLLIFDTC